MTPEETPRPCPFCGGDEFTISSCDNGLDYAKQCLTCYATGPFRKTKKDADKDYSSRPIEDQLRAEVERLKRETDVNERAMDSLIEDAQKLRAENEKLRNELDCQSHGICSNKGHGINSTCRYCADEEIELLKKENEEYKESLRCSEERRKLTKDNLEIMLITSEKLKSQLDRAKEAWRLWKKFEAGSVKQDTGAHTNAENWSAFHLAMNRLMQELGE